MEKQTACFTLGENVIGCCRIKLKGELLISQLEIILYGSANTKIRSGNSGYILVEFSDSHVYLNTSYWPLNGK